MYSTCLEDPTHAVLSLMQDSITSQAFKALTFAKVFLTIPVNPGHSQKSQTVGNSSFEKILDNAEEHDAILGAVAESVSALISNQLLAPQDLLDILKQKIFSGMKMKSSIPNLKKVSKLYQILNSFTNVLIAGVGVNKDHHEHNPLFPEILRFTLNSKKLTYCVTPKLLGKELYFIRSLCSTTVNAIIQSGLVAHNSLAKYSDTTSYSLCGTTTIEIGSAYVRIPSMRETISNYVQRDPPQLQVDFGFSPLLQTLFKMVQGSDTEEWPLILEFFTEVLGRSPNFTHDLGTLLNRSLQFVWGNCVAVSAQQTLRQYLKFYHKAVQALLKKGLATISNQTGFFDSITSLVIEMRESFRRRKSRVDKVAIITSIQQLLLLALEVLNDVILHNPEDFGTYLKEDVLDTFGYLPVIHGGCEPIRKCLLDTALNFRDPKFITLSHGGDEVEEKMRNVTDISNLRGLVRGGTTFVME